MLATKIKSKQNQQQSKQKLDKQTVKCELNLLIKIFTMLQKINLMKEF